MFAVEINPARLHLKMVGSIARDKTKFTVICVSALDQTLGLHRAPDVCQFGEKVETAVLLPFLSPLKDPMHVLPRTAQGKSQKGKKKEEFIYCNTGSIF